MKILYITYIDFGKSESGSTMRPQKMYQAFLNEGHDVTLLSGNQNYSNRKQRVTAVRNISHWLDNTRPDICYIESPVYPILWSADRRLIRKICRMGIPTAYFTRDCYDRLPQFFPKRTTFTGALKDFWLSILRRRTEATLQHVNINYFPSMNMAEFFHYPDMRALPPAGENHLEAAAPEKNCCVYVGGILNQYGGDILIEAFRLLNKEEARYKLILICREKEWAVFPDQYKGDPWVEVHHASGEALIPLISRGELGLLVAANDYWNYSFSIKLFEYMGYGLPVVFTHSAPADKLTTELNTGIGTDKDSQSVANAIERMLTNRDQYEEYRKNTIQALVSGQLWKHRVRQIISDLHDYMKG